MQKKLLFFQRRQWLVCAIVAWQLLVSFAPVQGQVFTASLFNDRPGHTSQDQRKKSLKEVFNKLEELHAIKITYQSDVVTNKFVGENEFEQILGASKGNLEDVLQNYISPLGLNFKQYKDDYYIIVRQEALPKIQKKPLHNGESSARPFIEKIQRNTIFFNTIQRFDKTISGQVTDENSEPLPGVNILVKGTTTGTVTDVNGNYRLSVADDATTLVYSSVGYVTEEISISGRAIINIQMVPDIQALSEIVVVGYGTQEKENLTGAVSPINAEQLKDRPITQTSSALQGLAPGVVVTQNLGTPGNDDAVIRIRGRGSISSDNSPLVLMDGIQVNMDDVNPEDIENISVLKDAASAAIYGARAANGVILITTKRATAGKFTVNADFSYGGQMPTMLPEFVSVKEQMLYEDVKRLNGGLDIEWGQDDISDYLNYLENNPPNDQYQNNDWYEAVVKNSAPLHREQLSVSGGSEKVKAMLSLVNLGQDGLIDNSDFNRKSIRANIDIDPLPWLGFSTDLFIQRSEQKEPAGESITEIFHMINELEPYRQLYVGDGLWGFAWRGENPLAFVRDGGNSTNKNNYTLLNINAVITPIEGLRIDLGYSNLLDENQIKRFVANFPYYEAGANIGDPPQFIGYNPSTNSLSMQDINRRQNYYKAIATYEKQLSQHYLKILVGGDATDYYQGTLSGFRSNFPLGIAYPQLSLGDREGMDNGSSETEWALASAFSRMNYSFMDRYLLEASFRYDGSSRFAEDSRWGFFPSVSGGWRISEEAFMEGAPFITDLKIRASWGKLGNQNIGSNYPYQSLVNLNQPAIINETSQLGAAITTWAVNDITWEESIQTDIGLDFGFFNNRLTGSFDYYIKNTQNVLLQLALPESSGLNTNFQNGAELENKGIEMVLGWRETIGDWSYHITGQFDNNTNEVISLLGTGPYIDNDRIRAEGETFDALYGWVSDGFLSKEDLTNPEVPKQNSNLLAEGSLKFKDLDENGVIDANDRTIIGNEFPRMNYSANMGVSWKGLSLNILLQGVGKRDGYIRKVGQSFGDHFYDWERDFYIPQDHPIFTEHGYDALGLKPNTDATLPAVGTDNGEFSDFWIKSRSYMRIKNVTLSYTLPQSMLDKLGLSKIRFYVSGDNLYTFHNFIQGFDPELTSGRGYWEYPNITRVIGGVNIAF